ncbi:hypothetical protein C8R45DRAFT_1019300 [Mycena sanguinolenta]|nr:hypothetical protein C8R45DRAFT_1019300 [Mycena sanguinolenta]
MMAVILTSSRTIFAIMTMEAVFVQMPSVRTHARNYIAPFVDSMTALLATRFILGNLKRRKLQDDDTHSFVSSRRSVESAYQTPRSSVTSLHSEGPQFPPGLPGSSVTTLSHEGSPLPPDPHLSVLFPAWPPAMDDTGNSPTPADQQTLGNWPSVTRKNNSFASLTALEYGSSSWPPERFEFECGYDNYVDPQAVTDTPQCNYPEPVPMQRGRRGSRTRTDTPLTRAAFGLDGREGGSNFMEFRSSRTPPA